MITLQLRHRSHYVSLLAAGALVVGTLLVSSGPPVGAVPAPPTATCKTTTAGTFSGHVTIVAPNVPPTIPEKKRSGPSAPLIIHEAILQQSWLEKAEGKTLGGKVDTQLVSEGATVTTSNGTVTPSTEALTKSTVPVTSPSRRLGSPIPRRRP